MLPILWADLFHLLVYHFSTILSNCYSTVTDFAKFLGLSTSYPLPTLT